MPFLCLSFPCPHTSHLTQHTIPACTRGCTLDLALLCSVRGPGGQRTRLALDLRVVLPHAPKTGAETEAQTEATIAQTKIAARLFLHPDSQTVRQEERGPGGRHMQKEKASRRQCCGCKAW